MQPIDELGLTHQQNVLLCVAVLCLYIGGGCDMLCVNGQPLAHNSNNNSAASKRSFSNQRKA